MIASFIRHHQQQKQQHQNTMMLIIKAILFILYLLVDEKCASSSYNISVKLSLLSATSEHMISTLTHPNRSYFDTLHDQNQWYTSHFQPNHTNRMINFLQQQNNRSSQVHNRSLRDRRDQSNKDEMIILSSSSSSSSSLFRTRSGSVTGLSPPTTPTSISFSVIGDAPYSYNQSLLLKNQILYNISRKESLFLVHLGDIRCDDRCGNPLCQLKEYTYVSSILQLSSIPVFMLLGDNDWNDCPNPQYGLQYWKQTFLYYDNKYWNSSKSLGSIIRRQYLRNENFSYTIQNTLFIGLNIVGGTILDQNEWNIRLKEQYKWARYLIQLHMNNTIVSRHKKRIVLFGHAYPRKKHDLFFIPLSNLIKNELLNQIPIVYIHGDIHSWQNETNYMNQTSFLRISVVGEVQEYPLYVTINTTNPSKNPNDVFKFRRRFY
jgi:hypothetical protein